MFDKRLLAMVPGAAKYILANVLFQWIALVCNIALFIVIGLFLQATFEGAADAAMAIGVLAAAALAIAVRMACQTAAQRMGQRAAAKAKCAIRQQVYDKLVALGPAYNEAVATSVAVQVSVEGTEQLESYFGQYVPQLFYALIAPLRCSWRSRRYLFLPPWHCSCACRSFRRLSWSCKKSPAAPCAIIGAVTPIWAVCSSRPSRASPR